MLELNNRITLSNAQIDVLTVGEILIDMISDEYDDFNNGGFHRYFGGSPGNIAINVSKLGYKSSIITNVGNDSFGKFLLKKLKENGVNTDGVTLDDSKNTSMVVVSKSKKSPSFIAYRDADKNLKLTDKVKELVKQSKIVHFTSWPISYEPARSTTLEIIDIAKEQGKIISFDPNYRKVLWEKGHDGVKFIEELLSRVDIIKPSEDDAYHIFGEDTPEGYIKRFLDLGVKLVMLTLGKDGVIVSNGKEIIKVPTLATEVVDTTGAGDAFWSGFYAGLLKGKTIKESIMVGSAVSAYKLREVGAIADLPNINEIEKIYKV
ncbi:carbohydrate kinase family protein [Caldisalinibacter kiritimatiensis]|uniref:Fructokinase n=1 Tax=Caldisalinibacter kiritimatiensis TaxID=1304284 RepID=R1CGW3_9FIRM|nr:carbohydrate kinase [Caldisalinibacter kiritimatiensis]EOD01535.1 Fructokinase [Caldisalinibacter kiritimatiensis]